MTGTLQCGNNVLTIEKQVCKMKNKYPSQFDLKHKSTNFNIIKETS